MLCLFCVPLVSLVSEHGEMGIADVIYHVIRGRHVEAITPPIHRHISRTHGVEHVHIEFFETVALKCHGAGIFECRFVHVSTIQDQGTKSSDSGRFENWSEAADLGII